MKMLARVLPFSGSLLLASGLIACADLQMRSQPAPTPEIESAPTDAAATPPLPVNWSTILGPTSVPVGWRVSPCENPALLCVYTNGEIVGTVELFNHAVAGSSFEPMLAAAKGQRIEALNAWVADHYGIIERDRKVGTPTSKFVAEPPETVTIGSLPGLRYSFSTTQANGTVDDRSVGYVTTDGTSLYVVAMTATDGDHSGSFSSIKVAQQFEPYLAEIVSGLKL